MTDGRIVPDSEPVKIEITNWKTGHGCLIQRGRIVVRLDMTDSTLADVISIRDFLNRKLTQIAAEKGSRR